MAADKSARPTRKRENEQGQGKTAVPVAVAEYPWTWIRFKRNRTPRFLTRIIREWEEIGRQKKPPLLQTC
jgi:hypothetical protein